MSKFSPCSLWDFAISVYSAQGVENACLALQERRDVDVSLLLFFIWSARQGFGVLSNNELELAIAISDDWQMEIIKPLRGVRGVLKAKNSDIASSGLLRKSILQNELDAERLELENLHKLLTRKPMTGQSDEYRIENAKQTVLNYLSQKTSNAAHSERDLKDVALICKAAF